MGVVIILIIFSHFFQFWERGYRVLPSKQVIAFNRSKTLGKINLLSIYQVKNQPSNIRTGEKE